MLLRVRSKMRTPSSCSSNLICRLMPDCDRFKASAAADML